MIRSFLHRLIAWGIASLVLLCTSCRKDDLPQHAGLRPSTDTVRWDSVFVNHTSVTKRIALRNYTGQERRITSIKSPSASSPFHLLLDAEPLDAFSGVPIRNGDSLMLIARFRPEIALTDSITRCFDSVLFTTDDGATTTLYLYAQTLTAHPWRSPNTLHRDTAIGRPASIIRDTLYVPAGVTLTLLPGAELYFEPSAALIVDGTLRILGSPQHPVTLAGSRLETYYRRRPGQWPGIALNKESGPHTIHHATIRGAINALSLDSCKETSEIRNSRILYSSLTGVTIRHCSVHLYGSIVAQNYRHNLLLEDAYARMVHCTFWNETNPPDHRSAPQIRIRTGELQNAPLVEAYNSIIWGDRQEEILLTLREKDPRQNGWFTGSHLIARISEETAQQLNLKEHILLKAPKLRDPLKGLFDLLPESPARKTAHIGRTNEAPNDLNGTPRVQNGKADIGAITYTEKEDQ